MGRMGEGVPGYNEKEFVALDHVVFPMTNLGSFKMFI